jgi:hypothetical protein
MYVISRKNMTTVTTIPQDHGSGFGQEFRMSSLSLSYYLDYPSPIQTFQIKFYNEMNLHNLLLEWGLV